MLARFIAVHGCSYPRAFAGAAYRSSTSFTNKNQETLIARDTLPIVPELMLGHEGGFSAGEIGARFHAAERESSSRNCQCLNGPMPNWGLFFGERDEHPTAFVC
ncbi:hypothetical protein Smed_6362 (plasmid) [Sinorhizobium medicae WSM419]|uniref:Uncharacterized protein n=1 Tax=Sinorhizobium medicae (strain WSM419) TaxID=366394 RepID=A6UMS2_SINMW|nr:hypothetical protein Smed_6362 [Sinorhizobium medicae WSM419]